jgi:hypothetical protein
MQYVKLTLCEAGFLKDTLEELSSESMSVLDDQEEAIKLLQANIDNSVEEAIPEHNGYWR